MLRVSLTSSERNYIWVLLSLLDRDSGKFGDPYSHKNNSISAKTHIVEALVSGSDTDRSSTDTSMQMRNSGVLGSEAFTQVSKAATGLEAKQVKGALPQGFFDDKDADLLARGITPVKPDIKWVFVWFFFSLSDVLMYP